jgi:guanylate kinase
MTERLRCPQNYTVMSRIIIVGPAAAGKDYLKRKFGKQGFKLDVSYTSRQPREGEVDGVDYKFVEPVVFEQQKELFYEFVQHGEISPQFYGTGQWEWDNCEVFIMESHGISQISKEDRKNCFVFYLNPPKEIRQERLTKERGWGLDIIQERMGTDYKKFKDFKDYDIEITDAYF